MSNNLFGSWFDFKGFTAWKLHTVWDYVFFFAIIAVGVVAIKAAIRIMDSRRDAKHAVARTARALRRACGGGTTCYIGRTIRSKKDVRDYELIAVLPDKVLAVKVFPFGLTIYGGAGEPRWRFCFNKEERWEDNPLSALEEQKVLLNRVFMRAGVKNVPVETLIVFADNYGTAKFKIAGVRECVDYRYLRKWRKDTAKSGRIDMKAVKAALEAAFGGAEKPDGTAGS